MNPHIYECCGAVWEPTVDENASRSILRGIQTAEEGIVVAERWEVTRSHQCRVNEARTCHIDTNIVSSK
jgi:hypothetical protein